MRVIYTQDELNSYFDKISVISKEYPLTVSKFVEKAKEIEVDAVAQNGNMVAFVVSEHVENAGVHSGDASIIFPPQKIYLETYKNLRFHRRKLGKITKNFRTF